jgi:hypothetical protein
MAITPYLTGPYYFDLETRRVLGLALEMACITLGTGDDDHVKHAIANELIALAKGGERNPEVLCDRALEEICRPTDVGRPAERDSRYNSSGGLPTETTSSAQSRASAHIRAMQAGCLSLLGPSFCPR